MCTLFNIPKWYETAKDIGFDGSTLYADLKKVDGNYAWSKLDFNEHLSYSDGLLYWGKGGGIAGQSQSLEWEEPSTLVVALPETSLFKLKFRVDLTWIVMNNDGEFQVRTELARRFTAIDRGYGLEDYHILTAWVYDETTGNVRKSTLDLDYCLQTYSSNRNWWEPARAPKDFKSRYRDELTVVRAMWKWSKQYAEENKAIDVTGNILHVRVDGDFGAFDSVMNINDFVRRTRNGHIEWMHPPYKASMPEWLEIVIGMFNAMAKTPSSALETAIDLAKDKLFGDMSESTGSVHKDWMRGTYVEEGILIRHGT